MVFLLAFLLVSPARIVAAELSAEQYADAHQPPPTREQIHLMLPPIEADAWELDGREIVAGNDWLALVCDKGTCALHPSRLHVEAIMLEQYDSDPQPGQRVRWQIEGLTKSAHSVVMLQTQAALDWLKPGPVATYYSGAGPVPRAPGPGTLEAFIREQDGVVIKLMPVLVKTAESNWMRLELHQGEASQILEQFTSDGCEDRSAPIPPEIYLRWSGDLDGDGAPDYLLNLNQQANQAMLFLSSYANDGEWVGYAGVFEHRGEGEGC